MLDTVAAKSLIAAYMLDTLVHEILPLKLTAKVPGQQTIELMGTVTLGISLCDVTSTFKFHVVPYFAASQK